LQAEVKELNAKLEKLKDQESDLYKSSAFRPSKVSKGAKGAPASVDNPGVVVDVPYPAGGYFSLPVDFLRKNSDGKTYDSSHPASMRSSTPTAQTARNVSTNS
jgi:predicted AlkP superfamily phosphohydrolase/phosphomutase